MERGFLAVHDDGMPRVVSALKADHIVDLLSQKIDELALSLVAPLDADDPCNCASVNTSFQGRLPKLAVSAASVSPPAMVSRYRPSTVISGSDGCSYTCILAV